MRKIVFIAKTNLNNDGRILNELRMLKEKFTSLVSVDFILMPDKPLEIEVKEVDKFYIVNTFFRNNKFLRFFTVFEFTFKSLLLLNKIKPEIIHAQDTAVTLPVFLYKLFNSKVSVIYDDHEVPNENESLQIKIFQLFENLLMNKADVIIAANKERIEYLDKNSEKSEYLLNLPYYEANSGAILDCKVEDIFRYKVNNNVKFIMHQGIIEYERGREKLAHFSEIIPANYLILIVGVSRDYFDEFIGEFSLDISKFYFVGSVPYNVLNQYWKVADASIVMYLPNYINNRLCAPNRLYISYLNQLPIIVNEDNPVLKNFISNFSCGVSIESLTKENLLGNLKVSYSSSNIKELISNEISKFENIYQKILF